MRRLALILVVVAGAGVLLVLNARTPSDPSAVAPPGEPAWSRLDAQARCDSALALVTHPDRWPVRCQWRSSGDLLAAQSFPPPVGPPPYDDPHVEVYVASSQTREELAHTIAHELGHMHHTREPAFVDDWLAARNLPPDTPADVWTEDYGEVFATLFSPPAQRWRAPTPKPSPEALASLKTRFFT